MGSPLFLSNVTERAAVHRASIGRFLLVLFLLFPLRNGFAEEPFFYQKLEERGDYRNSCAKIFTDIRQGKPEDVGGVVRNLKYINVDYRLRDYDNALSSDPRKHYVDLETVRREVEETKRESYCRIELAMYMKGHPQFAGPVYDELLEDAYVKLEATYASALKSLEQEDFARALYAFELVAPYKDAYRRALVAQAKLAPPVAEASVAMIPADEKKGGIVGPIAQALAVDRQAVAAAETDENYGAIARAAQVGAITAAVQVEADEK